MRSMIVGDHSGTRHRKSEKEEDEELLHDDDEEDDHELDPRHPSH